jgi:hypothetical protein
MLNLSVKTRLKPEDALTKIEEYFVQKVGLTLVEGAAHLHAKTGFAEVRVSGGKIVGKEEYDSRNVLFETIETMKREYGFTVIYYLFHIHTSPSESIGHLVITVSNDTPAEINFQSEELDYQVKEFAEMIPKS